MNTTYLTATTNLGKQTALMGCFGLTNLLLLHLLSRNTSVPNPWPTAPY